MIFFYQIRTLTHQVTSCPDLTCPLCGSRGGVEIGIYQKYAWMLMPMWPEHKFGMAACTRCNHTIPNLKWTDELEQRYYQLKEETRTPLRLWRGIFINPLLLLVFAGTIGGLVFLLAGKNKRKAAEDEVLLAKYIAAPKAGDLYRTMVYINGTHPGFNYTYFRYAGISGDTLFVEKLKKEVHTYGDWDKLDTTEPDAFDNKKIPLKYAVFKKNQDFMVFGDDTMRFFFKGIDRGEESISKN